jgi:hypothetical protein
VVIFSNRLEHIEEYPTMTVLKEGGTRGRKDKTASKRAPAQAGGGDPRGGQSRPDPPQTTGGIIGAT